MTWYKNKHVSTLYSPWTVKQSVTLTMFSLFLGNGSSTNFGPVFLSYIYQSGSVLPLRRYRRNRRGLDIGNEYNNSILVY